MSEVNANPDSKALLVSDVRYRLNFGDSMLEFSAPEAKTREELGALLESVAAGLTAEGREVVGECDNCLTFILEGEAHVCAS